ncbi:Fungalysin metallopeptidase-domain-containing protein, partial [Thamnocephalis sphaerospora]
LNAALAFARSQLGVQDNGFTVARTYTTESLGIMHVYLDQNVAGIKVQNGGVMVNIGSDGRVVSYEDGSYKGRDASKMILWTGASSSRFVKPNVAFNTLANYIKIQVDVSKLILTSVPATARKKVYYVLKGVPSVHKDVRVEQFYVHTRAGVLEATWKFSVRIGTHSYRAHISADGTRVVALYDKSSSSTSYNVIKANSASPLSSDRTLIPFQEDKVVWPEGWHSYGGDGVDYDTSGNNVLAMVQEKDASGKETETMAESASGQFDFPLDLQKDPRLHKDAGITNLFYINNMEHGLLFRYGFNEAAGNFQEINFSGKGEEKDAVWAYAQDAGIPNNAYFTLEPDGERSEMHVGPSSNGQQLRDGSLDNQVIIHEYSHGLSDRLTSGSHRDDCLITTEAMGMAEGWSDFFAILQTAKSTDRRDTPRDYGTYLHFKHPRRYMYTTGKKLNPTAYGYILGSNDKHYIGNVWTTMLWEVYWNLVDALGYTEAYDRPDLSKGNTLAMLLVINAFKLQPCNPTFTEARNAIIESEFRITKGAHHCRIWAGFAARGLGLKAKM